MSFVQALLEKRNISPFIKRRREKLPKKWGENNKDIISTDDTVNYLINLLKEKRKNTGLKYAMTTSLTTHTENEKSIDEACETLTDAYIKIMKEKGHIEGIYTVLNVGAPNQPSHQNWLFFSPKTGQLLRFEPSQDYEIYRTDELCKKIVERLKSKGYNATYEIAQEGLGINTFSGCRALSTLLATLHVKGISFENLENIRGPNTKMFTYLMQQEMQNCEKTPMNRTTRKEPFPVVFLE